MTAGADQTPLTHDLRLQIESLHRLGMSAWAICQRLGLHHYQDIWQVEQFVSRLRRRSL